MFRTGLTFARPLGADSLVHISIPECLAPSRHVDRRSNQASPKVVGHRTKLD